LGWKDIKRDQRNESPPTNTKVQGRLNTAEQSYTSKYKSEVRPEKKREGWKGIKKGQRNESFLLNTKVLGRLNTAEHS